MRKCLLAAVTVFALPFAVRSETVDLYTAVTEAGMALSCSTTPLAVGNAALACNGVVYAETNNDVDPDERLVFKKASEGVNPSVTIKIPDGFAPDSRVALRQVTIYPVTYWNNAKKRMPTEYRVVGFDLVGVSHELSHPTGLTYPDLGQNGTEGQCYTTDVPPAVIEYDCREFKIEFLKSEAWEEDNSISFMEVKLVVEILPKSDVWEELYENVNFAKLLRDSGYPIVPNGNNAYTRAQNGWAVAANAFDGYTYHQTTSGDKYRWLGYMGRENGTFVSIRTPEGFMPDDVFVPIGGKIWTLTYNSNEIKRAPVDWTLYGLGDDRSDDWTSAVESDTAWASIHSAVGLDWSNVKFNVVGQNTLGYFPFGASADGYRAFRFRPTKSSVANMGTDYINVGFSEVEIFVKPVNRKGTLRVRTSEKGYDLANASHPDGATIDTATTVTIPEVVASERDACRVLGYRLENFDWESGEWVPGELVDSRSFSFTPDAEKSQRLVWVLARSQFSIRVVYEDDGNEAPVTVNGEAVEIAYLDEGQTVTLEAHPNTDELESANGATNRYRSAFVRWEGDTNGLLNVTSPTISFTVDGSRTLTPVYSRDWLVYEYDLANEGASGTEWRMKDGNFDFSLGSKIPEGVMQSGSGIWVKSGRGTADFSTKAVHYLTGEPIAIKEINLSGMNKDANEFFAHFTRVVMPKTLEKLAGSSFRSQTNLVEAVLDCPELKVISGAIFTRSDHLTRIVFKAPKLEKITGDYAFFKVAADDSDANDWDLSGLKYFEGGNAASRFSLTDLQGHGFKGTLSLPRIETIGKGDFSTQCGITNAVLGSATAALRQIGVNAFSKCQNLTHLTLGCTQDVEIEEGAFSGQISPALKEIRFLKHVPPRSSLDVLLTMNGVEPDERAILYVPVARLKDVWEGFLTPLDRSSAELDENAPADAVGAYVTAAGERKAWICTFHSPHDPVGLIFLLH